MTLRISLKIILALLIAAAVAAAMAVFATASPSQRVQATRNAELTAKVTTYVPDATPGQKILDKAETRTGDWYVYGGAGPSVFDCSGLVYWAAHAEGVNLPRTTYEMLASSLLERVYNPQRGDLAFFGTGHVEFVTIYHGTTFGAQQSGTRVGWHGYGYGYRPTAFYRIR